MNVSEPTPGELLAVGPMGVIGPTTSAAVVSCAAAGKGYVVTFTCVIQTPQNPYTADDLCLDVAHNFSGQGDKTAGDARAAPDRLHDRKLGRNVGVG